MQIDFGFLPIEEVHQRLSTADLAVLPYGPSNEGGSAAAATILGSRVPLLVSTSQVFEDILSAVDVLPDTKPQTIAAAICHLLGRPAMYEDLTRRGFNYVEAIAERWLLLLGA